MATSRRSNGEIRATAARVLTRGLLVALAIPVFAANRVLLRHVVAAAAGARHRRH